MKLTKRDVEILRTLARVQLVKTRCLQWVFFPTLDVARKRMRKLREYGLVEAHTKGLPGNPIVEGGAYWRLTEYGVMTLAEKLPNERIAVNLASRMKRASLRYFEHRDEMNASYLRLIYSKRCDLDEVVETANTIDWRGEYEVELDFSEFGEKGTKRIVPDATLTVRDQRVFIEVDRSTESLTRCRRTLKGYAAAIRQGTYRKRFRDELPVTVLYSTLSEQRARNLEGLMRDQLGLPYTALALPKDDATRWLRELVGGEAERPLEGVLRAEAARWKGLLTRLYAASREVLVEDPNVERRQGNRELLVEAYDALRAAAVPQTCEEGQ